MSNAWKMQGLDGKFCIAKFRTGGDRTALSEILCAYLSRRFGLPSLKPALMQLDKGQAEQISAERGRAGLPPVDLGRHFGAKFSDSLLTVRSYSIKMGRGAAESGTGNAEAVPAILGFDTLVQSQDRHCDNAGIRPDASGGRCSYRGFGHGLAFGGGGRSAESGAGLCHRMRPILEFCLVASSVRGPSDFEGFAGAFEPPVGRWMDEFFGVLPREWGPDARAGAEAARLAMADLERGALVGAITAGPCLHGGAPS